MEPGWLELIVACRGPLDLLLCSFKGVIWLLIATVAGVVPVVSLASFLNVSSLLFSLDARCLLALT